MSPDGEWAAQGAATPATDAGTRHVWLNVSKTDGTVDWRVVDEWSAQALGQTTPKPFAWSQNGRYLYFTNFGVPDGCPRFVNGSDMHRVDLSDGSVTVVVPGVGFWLALSPDESQVAYIGYGDRGLVVRDLATGEEREVALDSDVEDAQLGHVVWSPDGTRLVLTAGFDSCGPQEERTHSIIGVDLSEGSHTMLIERDNRLFITQAWHAPDYVLLTDNLDRGWEMNVNTGEVTQTEKDIGSLTITPAPRRTEPQPTNGSRFITAEGISFVPPAGWYAMGRWDFLPREVQYLFRTVPVDDSLGIPGEIDFVVRILPNTTIEERFRYRTPECHVLERRDRIVDRRPAVKIDFDQHLDPPPIELAAGTNLLVQDGDRLVEFSAFGITWDDYTPYAAQVEIIFGSISFQEEDTSSLPRSMKGYELYSWEKDGKWHFTLTTGTNRLKSVEEIISGESTVSEDGWVKTSVTSVDDIKEVLARLPPGEEVSWIGQQWREQAGTKTGGIILPPEKIIQELQEHCEGLYLRLQVVRH
jgi:hypothetical protein